MRVNHWELVLGGHDVAFQGGFIELTRRVKAAGLPPEERVLVMRDGEPVYHMNHKGHVFYLGELR